MKSPQFPLLLHPPLPSTWSSPLSYWGSGAGDLWEMKDWAQRLRKTSHHRASRRRGKRCPHSLPNEVLGILKIRFREKRRPSISQPLTIPAAFEDETESTTVSSLVRTEVIYTATQAWVCTKPFAAHQAQLVEDSNQDIKVAVMTT